MPRKSTSDGGPESPTSETSGSCITDGEDDGSAEMMGRGSGNRSRPQTSGAAASHASRFPSPASNSQSQTRGIFGLYSQSAFAWFDRDSFSWRTYQGSLLDDTFSEFSERLPRSGTMRNGRLSVPTKSERPIGGTGCGSGPAWATPAADTSSGDRSTMFKQGGMPLGVAIRRFPKPHGLSGNQGQGDGEFGKAIRQWSTPRASDGEKGGPNQSFGAGGTPLPSQVCSRGPQAGPSTPRMWPTPHSNASTGSGDQGREGGDNIQTAVARAAVPIKGQLHPCWVEWLMGYPIGHTVSDASEMQ